MSPVYFQMYTHTHTHTHTHMWYTYMHRRDRGKVNGADYKQMVNLGKEYMGLPYIISGMFL